MAKVFISYRRKPSAMLAQLISRELEKRNLSVFLDVRSMDGAGVFPQRLRDAIDRAQIVICLVAGTTFESVWVQQEIQYAVAKGKVLIPVFQESHKGPPPIIPAWMETLLQCEGVQILDERNIYVDEAINSLARLIQLTPSRALNLDDQRQAFTRSIVVPPTDIQSLTSSRLQLTDIRQKWVDLQKAAFKQHRSLPPLLDHAQPFELTSNMLIITVHSPLIQEKLNKWKTELENAITMVFKRALTVECVIITENDQPIPIDVIRQNWVELQKASFRFNRNLPPLLDHVYVEAVETNRVTLSTGNPIFKEKLEAPERYRALLQAFHEVFDQTIIVRIMISQPSK